MKRVAQEPGQSSESSNLVQLSNSELSFSFVVFSITVLECNELIGVDAHGSWPDYRAINWFFVQHTSVKIDVIFKVCKLVRNKESEGLLHFYFWMLGVVSSVKWMLQTSISDFCVGSKAVVSAPHDVNRLKIDSVLRKVGLKEHMHSVVDPFGADLHRLFTNS